MLRYLAKPMESIVHVQTGGLVFLRGLVEARF